MQRQRGQKGTGLLGNSEQFSDSGVWGDREGEGADGNNCNFCFVSLSQY